MGNIVSTPLFVVAVHHALPGDGISKQIIRYY